MTVGSTQTNDATANEQRPRVLIVSEHASAAFGGEAALPLHYFRVLKRKGVNVWLVVHARTRPELTKLYPGETRIHYVEDSRFHRFLSRISTPLPARLAAASLGYAARIYTQLCQRRIIRRLIAREGVEIVHQPMPVSPREPSLMYGLGVPVVMGPMNGNMHFPPAFSRFDNRAVALFVRAGRAVSVLLNRLMPGKLQAAALMVANERTRQALPPATRGKIVEVVENGVDLSLWSSRSNIDEPASDGPVRFVYMGRLVDWKAVDLLLSAFREALPQASMSLTVVGEGPERARLESMAREWTLLSQVEGEAGKVFFAGWQSQAECARFLERSSALVLPSLWECGGAVVLEAMAAGRPVIATAWGGPTDYLDPSCGILVAPTSEVSFLSDLRSAMVTLAHSHELRVQMGRAGRQKAINEFDWDRKVDRMLEIYRDALDLSPQARDGNVGSECRRSGA